MRHLLQLHIPHTMNEGTLTIQDTSVYADTIPISCPTLQVQLPGFTSATTINDQSVPALEPGFIRHLTACNLEVQSEGCGQRFDCLPDGIYVIRYSVSPNDIVYVEYNHLRVTQLMKTWQSHLCDLNLESCAPDEHKASKFKLLMEVKGYIDAAIANAEYCHKPTKAQELYNYAKKKLSKLDCTTGFC